MGDQPVVPVWASRTESGWRLEIRVVPGSSRTECAGPVGSQLKVKVAAPPNDGKANAELLRFVGASFRVRDRSLRIRRGLHGRSKVIEVTTTGDLPTAWTTPR
ncbi:MAG: DUF167 domain-containing protein [Microthrixaceae bacterium]|nr:DUF167 domain-containing protein [Microthrixaceae bacterium]